MRPNCNRSLASRLARSVWGRRCAAVVGLALGALPGCSREAPAPSVLLVVLDTVRADHTSAYGYERPTTIQLEAVARAGVLFEDVTAPASWTYPSHASLFTGELPWVHGAHLADLSAQDEEGALPVTPLREELPTLAERFAEASYRTIAVVANGWLRPEIGLTRGFARTHWIPRDGEVAARAAEEIERAGEQPLFLFVNLSAAHMPYRDGPGPWSTGLRRESAPEWARPYLTEDTPLGIDLTRVAAGDEVDGITRYLAGDLRLAPADLRRLGRLYDAGVRAADFALGRVLDAWTARHPGGVVAVTSDHGEALGEHGQVGHMSSVYTEVLRVPLVLAAPGRLPAGRRVQVPVSLTPLGSTLLRLAGQEAAGPGLPGLGGEPPQAAALVTAAAWPARLWAERAGGRFRHPWRLVRQDGWALAWADDSRELYDLAVDPAMERNVATRHPERVAALRQRVAPVFAEARENAAGPLRVSEETRARLRKLGYLIR